MDTLPVELIQKICDSLEYTDLLRCCQLNQWWSTVCSASECWKRHCQAYAIEPPTKTEFLIKLGIYKHNFTIFGRINRISKRLQNYLDINNLVQLKSSLQPPAPIQILEIAPGQLNELFMFYHLFSNGQTSNRYPLFGRAVVYDKIYSLFLQRSPRLNLDGDIVQFADVIGSLDRGLILRYNAVFYCDDAGNLFARGDSFSDFLEKYVDDLYAGRYDIDNGIISMFPNFGPNCAVGPVCNGLQVSVSTIPLPRYDLLYAYRITITFDPEIAPHPSCQLLTRSWEITDLEDQVEQVEGPGVIGLYPVFSKDERIFSYVSQTQYSKSMKGSFQFFFRNTGQKFRVPVPEFHFEQPLGP